MFIPRDLHEIKVVYDHTHIALNRHLCVGNVGGEYGYWLLKGNECYSAGGFPSNPILSGSALNIGGLEGDGEGGLRQINTCSKVPLKVNFLDDNILDCFPSF